MAFLTDRKRAVGLGSAKTGTHHHWHMTVTSVMLLGLVPLFVFIFGPMVGEPHAAVAAHFARPFPALVAALGLLVALVHFKNGVQTAIEDYAHGLWRKGLIIATISLSYTAAAVALYALARLAL